MEKRVSSLLKFFLFETKFTYNDAYLMGNKKILFKILQNVVFFNKMKNIVENHVHIFSN